MQDYEWLFREDDYIPQKDKDKFIDKSIFGVLKVLSAIKRVHSKRTESFLYMLSPTVKFGALLLGILLTTLAKKPAIVLYMDFIALLLVMLLSSGDRKRLLGVSGMAVLFTFIILLPSMLYGNLLNSAAIVLRVFACVTYVNILSLSTSWSDITGCLKLLFIPDIFIFVFDITIRNIYILGDMAMDMLYALRLRSIGLNRQKQLSVARIGGSLFIKSKYTGDEIFNAMECRGFTGDYAKPVKLVLGKRDIIFIICTAAVGAFYVVLLQLKF